MAIGATQPATPAAVADAAARSGEGEDDTSAPASQGDPRLPAGTMVSDRYRVSRVLGEGGMGVVYAAEHVLMRKEVALKVLHRDMSDMPEIVARFEREAIAAAHIDSPHVAGATDFGRLEDGSCYLVLELLRGTSLRDEIAKGPIPLPRAFQLLRGIAAGVSAAHVKGIVHRDLKPENVMLVDRDGVPDFVKVLDFGIAKLDTSVAAGPRGGTSKVLTQVGAVFGTPEYMAPEQAVGDTVDARADLYSLGVILLEMLTGRCPFQGNPMSILRERLLSVTPPDVSAVEDPGARELLTKLLAREPRDRVQTAADLIAALEPPLEERKPEPPAQAITTPSPTTTTAPVIEKKRGWKVTVGLVAVAGLAIGVVAAVTFLRRPDAKVFDTANAPWSNAASAETPSPSSSDVTTAEGATSASAGPGDDPAPVSSAASARAFPRTIKSPKHGRPPASPKKSGQPAPPKDTK